MEFKDYYQTLGVKKTAAADEIKKVFRKLARKFHPDINPGDRSTEARFKEITEAYEVLGDPEKRRKYDELGGNWRMYKEAQSADQNPFGAGWPFGGRGPQGNVRWNVNVGNASHPMSEEEVHETFRGDPSSNFFKTFFSESDDNFRTNRTTTRRKRKGQSIEQAIELNLEQAFAGVTERLTLNADDRTRTLEVRIPAGATNGSRVRIAGEGLHGTSGGTPGDLYLRVRIKTHPVFELKGRDLHLKASVPVTTAVLGGEIEVPTLDGKSLRLKIPSATQQGQVFRLKGQGLPGLRRASRGDMYAAIQVVLPEHLSKEARMHYEAIGALEIVAKGKAAKNSIT